MKDPNMPTQDLYDELMERAEQNKQLMKMLKIGDDAWNATTTYEKALKAMEGTSRPRTFYSNKSM